MVSKQCCLIKIEQQNDSKSVDSQKDAASKFQIESSIRVQILCHRLVRILIIGIARLEPFVGKDVVHVETRRGVWIKVSFDETLARGAQAARQSKMLGDKMLIRVW